MPKVVVDCFPERAREYRDGHAIVAIDVIRATTTAQTAIERGYRCFPVPSLEVAVPLAARLDDPLLVGELGGSVPYGFDLNNSPAAVAERDEPGRPLILLSTSGTRLLWEARGAVAIYAASLRNWSAQVERLAAGEASVALIGAGARNEFREEDQLCCAWIAEGLIRAGFEAETSDTEAIVERWSGQSADAFLGSNSVEYLRRTGQEADLEFVLSHVDDLGRTFVFADGELIAESA
jgi:2-phosphosulfolactate phosphatase